MRIPIVLFLALAPITLSAQQLESFAGMHLHFDSPGARSAAMGGAGSALDDEWSANPASLAGVKKQIIAIEESYRATTTRYVTGVNGNPLAPSSTATLIRTPLSESHTGVSAAMGAAPWGGLTWSLRYDEPLNERRTGTGAPLTFVYLPYNSKTARVQIPCLGCFGLGFLVPNVPQYDSSLQLQRWSGTAAWQSGPLSFGASARYARLREETGSVTLATAMLDSIDDGAWSYAAGVRWNITPSIHAAASYDAASQFNGTRTFSYAPPSPARVTTSKTLRTPPTIRAGIAVDAGSRVVLVADAVRIRYSRMGGETDVVPFTDAIFPDVTEIHAGAEARLGVVTLRAGWWRDPAHRLIAGDPRVAQLDSVITLIPNESEHHVTAGFSAGRRTRLDAAIDRGTRSTRAVVGIASTF
jgi:hypothetical protein